MVDRLSFKIEKIGNEYFCKLDKVKILYVIDGDKAGYTLKANSLEKLNEKIFDIVQEENIEAQAIQELVTIQFGEITMRIQDLMSHEDNYTDQEEGN